MTLTQPFQATTGRMVDPNTHSRERVLNQHPDAEEQEDRPLRRKKISGKHDFHRVRTRRAIAGSQWKEQHESELANKSIVRTPGRS